MFVSIVHKWRTK